MTGPSAEKDALLAQHQFAPKYPVVCSCGFSAGFAMDSETPWLHHVALVLREAGFTDPEDQVADLRVTRVLPPGGGGADDH